MEKGEVTTVAEPKVEKHKNAEIIANPSLENTRLVFTTPVRNEWHNGNLIRHIRAVLSQRIAPHTAIESHYILNAGYKKEDKLQDSFLDEPVLTDRFAYISLPERELDREELDMSAAFISDVVHVQKLSRLIAEHQSPLLSYKRKEYEKELQEALASEKDSVKKDVLRLAVGKAQQVSISAMNRLNESDERYQYEGISGLRTAGMDFVYKRFPDQETAMFMYDCDTVPAENGFSQAVISMYDKNPTVNYIFTDLSYLPAGTHPDIVGNSPSYVVNQARGYNTSKHRGSPQISFKRKVIPDLQRITGMGWQGDEDRDTALRLGLFYSDIQRGVLNRAEAIPVPVSLTSDREGFCDGQDRLERIRKEGIGEMKDAMGKFTQEREEFLVKIRTIEDPLERQQVFSAYTHSQEEYRKQQAVQSRMNRVVAGQFVNALAAGEIQIGDEVTIDSEAILKRNGGRALVSYVQGNQDLLKQLSDQDIGYINYLLGKREFPQEITQLTHFQKALREYLGEFATLAHFSPTIENPDDRPITDKSSYLQPLLAEGLAMGDIYFRYLYSYEMDEYRKEKEESGQSPVLRDKPLEDRSRWLDAELEQISMPSHPSRKEIMLGVLSQMKFPLAGVLKKALQTK